MRTVVAPGCLVILVGISLSTTKLARAQQPPPAAVPAAVPARQTAAPGPAAVPATAASSGSGAAPGLAPGSAPATGTAGSFDDAPLRIPEDLVKVNPGGLTGEQAGAQAAATSWSAKASEESLRSAAARVDEAWAGFLPRLSGVGKYTRLSEFTPPSVAFLPPGINLVATTASNGTPNPPTQAVSVSGGLSFPLVFNQWLFEATISVPISDYFLTIDQRYTAATHSREAAQWNVVGARSASLSNGKIAFYTWLRARGAVIVAVQALNDQKTHLRDARNQFAVGNASKADVLRAETAVASAELALQQASNLSDLTEKQLRVAMHLPEGQAMLPGEDLETQLPSFQGNLQQMTTEALTSRPEIRSADANAAAASEQASAAKAARYPNLSAFADGIYANPNPRVFPATQDWFASWDAGAQITWSPNDILVANGSVRDYESQVASIKANAETTRDGIVVEVQQDWQGVREADFAVDAGTRERTSAEEAYRVARELFNNGRGTSTTLTDAETDLTRARLDLLNAKANARIARVRLDHALGRDLPPASASTDATTAPRSK